MNGEVRGREKGKVDERYFDNNNNNMLLTEIPILVGALKKPGKKPLKKPQKPLKKPGKRD